MDTNRQEKIKFLQEQLLEWYNNHGRSFAWREETINDYEKVIAEILLQRTQARYVDKFYINILKKFPDWKSIYEANMNDVENMFKPLGLYKQRAERVKKLAAEMVKRNFILPKERKELESIPFIGQYIANAIELIIFDVPKPLLDVNMARVLERFFGQRKLADIRYDSYLQNLAHEVVKHNKSKFLNWAILDFAALVCKTKNPLCSECPIASKCKFFNDAKLLINLEV